MNAFVPAAADLPPHLRKRVAVAFWATVAGLVLYTAYVAVDAHVDLGLDTLVTTWLFSALIVAAGGLCLTRAAYVEEDRGAWLAFGIAMMLWAGGSITWSLLYASLDAPPYPSVSDGLYVAFYPAAYVGLMLLARRRVRGLTTSVWLDGMIGLLSVGAAGLAFVVPHLADTTGGSLAVLATNLAYPLGDLLLIALIAGMFALTSWRLGRAWTLLGVAVAVLAVADTLYLYRVAAGTFVEGTLLDAVWPAGMVLFAAAAWQNGRAPEDRELGGLAVLIAPSIFSLGSLFVLVWGNTHKLNLAAMVFAAGAILAVLVRMAFSFNELRALAETRRQATTDELTGLANRRALYARLQTELEARGSEGGSLALIVADLDGFKELNDTLGHHAGDELLTLLGPRVSDALDGSAMLARLGGDEFAVLLPDCDEDQAIGCASRIQAALEEPFPVSGLAVHIEASIGIAVHPTHADDAESLMQRADVAMYQAKIARTSFEVYAADRDVHSLDRLSLLGELRHAIESDELLLHYQPKGDIATGRVLGVEALVRWQHPTRGLLQPSEFIPMAEQTALMRPLTMKVLRTAVKQCREWADEGIDLSVAVNLAIPNLLDLHLPEDVARLLAEFMLPPSKLQLEVTENIVMADPPRVLKVLEGLKSLGVGLSLDDFGTGAASLAYMKQLPIDELKIDRSFVRNLEDEHTDAVIVRSTAELGHRLGLRVVAEGVESAAAWNALSDYGCEMGQGYWLLHPVPADMLREWMLRQSGERAIESLDRDAEQPAVPQPRPQPRDAGV
ncbi:MAG: diguanylate cyclase [Thermoleophilaceae bacterium]|nr:diguanylate cyclase [Thermoleophilaceae bacterium]